MVAIFPFYSLPFLAGFSLANFADEQVRYQFFGQSYAQACQKNFSHYQWCFNEKLQVDWLILRFNQWFFHHNTVLVRGDDEPEYFAPTDNSPAKIVFAHGFFASCLHEISHWCVAGKKRREMNDFGYWYVPDGRNQNQQALFEQVEIVPQAIECLLSLTCGKKFRVSQDNLFADFDTSGSTFAKDVEIQAIKFWQTGEKLPTDAKLLLKNLAKLRPLPLNIAEIEKNFKINSVALSPQAQ